MSRRTEQILFLLIIVAALVLRLYVLRDVPPGAQHDEVFSANFATQLLKGARLVYFDQNGGVMALYAYLVAPLFAAFGANILTLRLISVGCGMLTIVFTYLLARRLFSVRMALVSAALLSVTQWHLFESRVGLEPIALMMMASATGWLFANSQLASSQSPIPNPQLEVGSWVLGFLLGLTMYTYHSAPLVFVALALFSFYVFLFQRACFKQRWRSLAITFITALLVSAPLALHILTTPGDATSRAEDLSLDLRAALDGDWEPLGRDVLGVLGMFAFTGDPSFRYNLPGRPVFTFGVGLLAYVGFALALRRWRDPRYAFVVIWIVCNVLASAVTRSSPSYLRSSAALPLMVMLPGIALYGLRGVISPRATHTAQFAIVCLVLLLLGWEAASTIHDYFVTWPSLERVRNNYRADLAEIAEFLDRQRPAGTVMLSARFPFDLDQEALYLLQQHKQRYQWFNGRRVLVLPNDRSGQGVSYFVPKTNESLGDGAALLKTLEAHTGPVDEKGTPFFTLYYLPADELNRLRARAPQIPLRANANNEVELIGVDTRLDNRSLHVLLYWRVKLRVRGDVDRNFFVHVVDAGGRRWTQEDRSAYPTSSWQDDDIVWQWYDLKLPDDAPAGDYWIDLGIYDANAPGQPRVNILDANGQVVDNRVRVGPFKFQ